MIALKFFMRVIVLIGAINLFFSAAAALVAVMVAFSHLPLSSTLVGDAAGKYLNLYGDVFLAIVLAMSSVIFLTWLGVKERRR